MKIKMKFIFILVLSVLMLRAVPALSQNPDRIEDLENRFNRTGQASMPFLKLGAGARTMAMADAVVALKGDVSALFYNPAGIAYVENRSLMVGNMSWLLDTNIFSGAFAINFGDNIGTFGISAMYFDYGDPIIATEIDATSEFGFRDRGEFSPSQWAIGVAYARQITDKFAIGGQVKLAHEDLLGGDITSGIAFELPEGGFSQEQHDAKTSEIAFDFGTIYNTGFRDILLSFSVRNFGSDVQHEQERYDLPLQFRFGMSADFFTVLNKVQEGHSLLLNVDYQHPRDWREQVHAGAEYAFNDLVFVRGGYKFNYSSEGITLGAGVKVNAKSLGTVRVDYAFKDTEDPVFDAVHVYTLNIDF